MLKCRSARCLNWMKDLPLLVTVRNLSHFLQSIDRTSYLGECRCGVCVCVLTCVDGGAVLFKNITSYLGEWRCGECVCVLSCACVDRWRSRYVKKKNVLPQWLDVRYVCVRCLVHAHMTNLSNWSDRPVIIEVRYELVSLKFITFLFPVDYNLNSQMCLRGAVSCRTVDRMRWMHLSET